LIDAIACRFEPSGDDPQRFRDARRRAVWTAAAYLLVALLAGAFRSVGGFATAEPDFYSAYAPQAARLAHGEAYTWSRSGPGYSMLLAIGSLAHADLFLVAKAIAALGVAALGYFAFLLGASLSTLRAASWAQWAIYCALFRYGIEAGNDVPCAAFSIVSLWCLLASDRLSAKRLIAAGLFAGLAAITRYPALALMVAAVASLLAFLPANADRRARATATLEYLAGFAVASGPWWILNALWNGGPFAGKAYALVALDAYADPSRRVSQGELAIMEQRFDSFGDVLLHDPLRWLAHLPEDFYADAAQFLADVVTLPCALALGFGAAALCAGKKRRRVASLFAYALLAFAAVALAPYQSRYHLAIAPIFFVVAAAGFDALLRASPPIGLLRSFARAWIAIAALVLVASSALLTVRVLRDQAKGVAAAASVLKRCAREGDSVVTRTPHLAYLAGLQIVPPIEGVALDQFFAWVRENTAARFVYVGEREVASNWALAEVAAGEHVPADFEVVDRSLDPRAVLLRRR
jgi:hypothetical protein